MTSEIKDVILFNPDTGQIVYVVDIDVFHDLLGATCQVEHQNIRESMARIALIAGSCSNRPRRRSRPRPRNAIEHLGVEDDDEHEYEHELWNRPET